MTQSIHVAVGVIIATNAQQQKQYFLTKRLAHAHQGGKWEFPGGKVEANETVHQALQRELKEEVAIDVLSVAPLMEISHDYGDKSVLLEVFVVDNFTGEAKGLEGQEGAWFTLAEFDGLNFPAANQAIIDKLHKLYGEM